MSAPTIDSVEAAAYTVPTDAPEGDGTLTWDSTTIVVVRARAGEVVGTGWTYGSAACAQVVSGLLADVVTDRQAMDVTGSWAAMVRAVRNAGRPGLVSMAISAVDLALWDLKARILGLPLDRLLGRSRDSVPVYGSGGFVSMSDDELVAQLEHWTGELGIPRVKIKVGQDWGQQEARDLARTALVRRTVGDDVAVFVDANGGYTSGQARRMGRAYDDLGVTWFEEPVSSEDLSELASLRWVLQTDIAAGEYLDGPRAAEQMLSAQAVDCLQLDATRCLGITGWTAGAGIALAHGLQVSGHCGPALHVAVAASIPNLRHLEYFADHARLERMLFDGVTVPVDGALPLPDGPGNGYALSGEAERYRTA